MLVNPCLGVPIHCHMVSGGWAQVTRADNVPVASYENNISLSGEGTFEYQ